MTDTDAGARVVQKLVIKVAVEEEIPARTR